MIARRSCSQSAWPAVIDGDVAGPGLAQPILPRLAHGPPDRTQQRVMSPGPSLTLDDHHPVRAAQVVVKRLGPGQRALIIGPGQQVMHQIAAQPQFGVGDAAQPGQFHGQHGRAVFQGHQVGAVGAPPGVDEGQHPHHVGARRGQQDQPLPVPGRRAGPHQPAQQVLALGEGLLRVRVRPARAGPGGQVAVPVLDRDRHPGQLVQGLRDARLALPGDRHPGEPLVDVHAALQAGDGLGERGIRGGQFGRGGALPGVQPGVRHGHPGLLRDDLDQEPLLGGGLRRRTRPGGRAGR